MDNSLHIFLVNCCHPLHCIIQTIINSSLNFMKSPCQNFQVLSPEQIFAKNYAFAGYYITDLLSLVWKTQFSNEILHQNNKCLIHFTWIILINMYIHLYSLKYVYLQRNIFCLSVYIPASRLIRKEEIWNPFTFLLIKFIK